MLQLQNISYHIGELQLLRRINWTITPGKRVGLIGPNGAGKTTLLRLIKGELALQGGKIMHPAEYSIGYLPQEEIDFGRGSILRLVMAGRQRVLDMEDDIRSIHTQLEGSTQPDPALLEKLGVLETHFSVLGGYDLEAKAKKILAGLGFRQADFRQSLRQLSGGWRMRVYLGRLLLQEPDLLLMDEPTNHLDIASSEWLEEYLKNYKGSLVIVSHDRFFLDRLVQEIVELYHGQLTHYAGNYHFYEKKKEADRAQILKKIEAQKADRAHLEKFINRFRYKASKAAQVQSRVKRLEKLQHIALPEEQKTIHFRIKADVQSFKDVLQIKSLYFRYRANWVLHDLNCTIYRGDKVALVGANGAGKTTLTRLISGELAAQRGQLILGERVHPAYYAQHQSEALDLERTVFAQVEDSAAPSLRPFVRDILGVFRFSGNDVNKEVKVLSGGEKARVSLAKILLSPANFLIMDEPTNHLDSSSKAALETALAEYDGALLLISHDRYFLDKLVNRVIELREGRLHFYEGDYSAYLQKRTAQLQQQNLKEAKPTLLKNGSGRQIKSKAQKQKEAQARQAVSRQRRRLQDEIIFCEQQSDQLHIQQKALEKKLADPANYTNAVSAKELQHAYKKIQQQVAAIENRWEIAQIQLEEIMNRLNNLTHKEHL